MTEEQKKIINDIVNGLNITPENLVIAKQSLDKEILDNKAKGLSMKKLQNMIDNAMQDYIKANGEISFNDGKDKEYYLKDKSKIVISDDADYRNYLKDLYPLLFKQVEEFDEDSFEDLYLNGSITDSKALAGITTKVTTDVKSRVVKKSKKTTTVATEGGDE